MPQKDENIRF